MTAAPLVRVEGLSVDYRQGEAWLAAVEDVSFAIRPGEVLGLVGESGCGKSTLAYQLLGYRHPSARVRAGRVLFGERDLLTLDRDGLERLRGDRISFVAQNPTTALSPGMRIGRQVAELLARHGKAPSQAAAAARIDALFDQVGLPASAALRRRYPHELSGGQQQRVVIAMALACDPDLVVLDEPTTGLDVTTQRQIIDLLQALRQRFGMSMVYVTHDLLLLQEIADRIGVMYAGHLVEIGPTATLFGEPAHPYTAGLIGSIPQLDGSRLAGGRTLRGLLRRSELPPGCPLFPRCDRADPSCAERRQRLEPVAAGHDVACQNWRRPPPPAAADEAGDAADRVVAGEPLLRLEGVSLGYGFGGGPLSRLLGARGVLVADDVSLSIRTGEVVALIGESGSGKSTIARAICGLIAPQAGSIRFLGAPLPGLVRQRPTDQRRAIQYVFQNPDASLNPRMRVGEILTRPIDVFFGRRGRGARDEAAKALLEVRLDASYLERFPDQLSGGERQRVAIARALAAQPALLLCDEVLSALDVSVQARVLLLLRQLRRETGVAMLFISHDLTVVRSLADRVGVLYRGALVEEGSVDAIFAPPYHPYTHNLLLAVPGGGRRPAAAPRRRPGGEAAASARAGCVFAGRCAFQVDGLCASAPPPWQSTGSGLKIRCHLPIAELGSLTGATS